jgi:hypothetical protein
MRRVFFALALLTLGITHSVTAADFGLGLRAGTYGIGAELGVGFTPWFGLRAGGSTLDVSEDYDQNDINYDGTLKLGGYGLWVDFFPMKGTFRLTAGMLSNRNAIDLKAVPTDQIDIGDGTYDPEQVGTLIGDIEFDSTVPYFGIGWGNIARGKRIGFLADLGVVWQGAGAVTLDATAGFVDPDDLAAEAAQIEDDIEDYEFWPIVSVGLSIRF